MKIAVCKQCRRESEKLFLKGDRCLGQKCAVTRKPYTHGFLGAKANTRLSDYGKQLRAKQKARRYYQIAEKQFSNYYLSASKQQGNTSELLWQSLELRLDNVIRKILTGLSIISARQLIGHGFAKVNGKKVNIPSYRLKVGDEISVKKTIFQTANKQSLPKWISSGIKSDIYKVREHPQTVDAELPFNISLVIEFYSK